MEDKHVGEEHGGEGTVVAPLASGICHVSRGSC